MGVSIIKWIKLDFGYYNMDCMAGMKLFPDKYFECGNRRPTIRDQCAEHGDGNQ